MHSFELPRAGGWLKLVLALYVLAAALMPFGHHDLLCHLKSTTHCTTCTVGSSAEVTADPAALGRFSLFDAGAAPCDSPRPSNFAPNFTTSGRAPPSVV